MCMYMYICANFQLKEELNETLSAWVDGCRLGPQQHNLVRFKANQNKN